MVCVFVFAVLTAEAVCIWNYGKKDEARPADAVIVLGAGTSEDTVSPVFRERLNHGISLYKAGYAGKMILTGGYGEGNMHSDAYTARQYVVSQGVREEDILIEEESAITWENIENAKSIMEEHSLSAAIIVSDPLHMKRAMLMAGDAGIEAYSSPTPTTMYRSTPNKLKFLIRELFFYTGYQFGRVFQG